MAATITPRAVFRAATFAVAATLAAPAVAQDDSGAGGASDGAAASQQIVTDPDLRRLEERRRRIAVLSGLFERQTRVFRISYRLLYAAVDMCADSARPAVGFTYANAFMFQGAVRTAASDMGLTHRVSIVEVAGGSAAERAGLRKRDQLLAIGDWAVPYGEGAVTLTQAKLRDVLVRDNRATLHLRRDGNQFSVVIEPDFICDIKILAVPGEPIRAYAGEDNVVVFQGLHEAIDDDDVMAAALAREIANHLIPGMGLDTDSGLDWSDFFNWGFEPEATGDVMADQSLAMDHGNAADYVGAYLMARAGFDHHKAPVLWQQMAARPGPAPEYSYGVPDPEYVQGLQVAIAEIDQKLAAKAPLRPEIGGPPIEFAAAPAPAGPTAPPADTQPEPAAVAEAPQVEAEPAPSQRAPMATAEAPPPATAVEIESGNLPWLNAEQAPETEEPAPNTAPPSGTEVAGMPWTAEPAEPADPTTATPEPAANTGEITVSALDNQPPQEQSAAPEAEVPPTTPNRPLGTAILPVTEPPEVAMAALGLEPPVPEIIVSEAVPDQAVPPAPVETITTPEVTVETRSDPAPTEATEVANVVVPTAQNPASEPPQVVIAALLAADAETTEEIVEVTPEKPAEQVEATPPESAPIEVEPAPPIVSERRILQPPTGESEIAVLFRDQGSSADAVSAMDTSPDAAEASDEPAAPQVAAVALPATEPPLVIESDASRAADDYDIGDLIRELEATDDASANKLATPEPEAPHAEELPWLSEAPGPAASQPDAQAPSTEVPAAAPTSEPRMPVLPVTTDADSPNLSPPSPSETPLIEPNVREPAAAPTVEQDNAAAESPTVVAALPEVPERPSTPDPTTTPPEPIADIVPMFREPSVQAVQVPDVVPAPVDALPALVALPDTTAAAAPADEITDENTPRDEARDESVIDLVAPAAGQSSPGADPADLGNGFSFRAWLGEG